MTALALLAEILALLGFLPSLQVVLFGLLLAYICMLLQQRAERYLGPTPAAVGTVW